MLAKSGTVIIRNGKTFTHFKIMDCNEGGNQ